VPRKDWTQQQDGAHEAGELKMLVYETGSRLRGLDSRRVFILKHGALHRPFMNGKLTGLEGL
jgi:hypothetical protein